MRSSTLTPACLVSGLILLLLSAASPAQTPASAPKKNPFEGWGTSLDRRHPASLSPTTPVNPFSSPPARSATAAEAGKTAGINLAKQWATRLALASGGHSLEIRDIKFLLSRYGQPSEDLSPQPDVLVYPGIHYLAPFAEAEKILLNGNAGLTTVNKVACGGFPDGLLFRTYDFKNRPYNRLLIVTDLASQVVGIEMIAEHSAFIQPGWERINANWHVYDYVSARVKGQPRIEIITQVADHRNSGKYIVVHTTSFPLKQATTWYVPQPLINLILRCAEVSGVK